MSSIWAFDSKFDSSYMALHYLNNDELRLLRH